MNKAFHFKKFTVNQDQCAMKIGTDNVLLGAWTSTSHHPSSILDIGAGSGILSLMLAQRSLAETIDAVEINDLAFEQCVSNFENSPWADRLFCYHASFKEYVKEIEELYDLIISNPPFYSETYKTKNATRDLARFQDALPFKELLNGVSKLLTPKGLFCVVVPHSEESNFIALASFVKLFPNKILHLKGMSSSEIKRSFIEFSFTKNKTVISELIIEITRGQYTREYINLTKDFYLKM